MILYANDLRAKDHISGKTTFRTLCAPAHKVQEICLPGSEGGAKLPSSLPLSNAAICNSLPLSSFHHQFLASSSSPSRVAVPLAPPRRYGKRRWRPEAHSKWPNAEKVP
jgi:hypothetical protein